LHSRLFIQFGFLKEDFDLQGASSPREKWFPQAVGTSYSTTYVAMTSLKLLVIKAQIMKHRDLIQIAFQALARLKAQVHPVVLFDY
jgi:hypothetical protein